MYIGILYLCIYKRKEDNKVSPRTGRPTDNPKNKPMPVRLSESDMKKLEHCSKTTGKSKAEIIRMGIDTVYNEIRATDALEK